MNTNTLHTVAAVRTYAREVAAGTGAVTAPTWDGIRSRLSSLDARDAQNAHARHLLVVSMLTRGVAQKDVAAGLDVGSSQVTNMRKSLTAWESAGLSDDAVAQRVTVAGVAKPVAVWTLFTNPDRGIRDHAEKSQAWANMVAGFTASDDDAARVAAVVAYVEAYVKPESTPVTFVDKVAALAKAAEKAELSQDEKVAVAQMLLDIAASVGLSAPADARTLTLADAAA
jgi:hypothetical protein